MIIDLVSDLHGCKPALHGGDLLIVAGDLTARDTFPEYCSLFQWISRLPYRKKIVIGGNHDGLLDSDDWFAKMTSDFTYLCDAECEFEGLKIWGTPWTKTFEGMNPKCKAFTCDTEEELAEKWALIPNDTDILITHSPPYGNLDVTKDGKSVGSYSLWERYEKVRPKLFVFGHIHESYGCSTRANNSTIFINASHVNERYQPVNKPVRIAL